MYTWAQWFRCWSRSSAVNPQVTDATTQLLAVTFRQVQVIFPTTYRHRTLAGTKLYCLTTGIDRCEQLAPGREATPQPGIKLVSICRSYVLRGAPPRHINRRVHVKQNNNIFVKFINDYCLWPRCAAGTSPPRWVECAASRRPHHAFFWLPSQLVCWYSLCRPARRDGQAELTWAAGNMRRRSPIPVLTGLDVF